MIDDGARGEPTPAAHPAPTPSTRLARVVTETFSPAVLVAGVSLAVAWHSQSVAWGLVLAVFGSAIPMAYIARGIRRGRYTDRHVSVREHRPAVIVAAAVSVTAGFALMLLLDAPRELIALVAAMLVGLAATFAVTKWWGKVSLHTAVATGVAGTLVLVFGPWFHLTWALVGAIAWSRVRLQAHTVTQTAVGALLGALTAGIILPLLR
jgi:membrane-associated phospholipid phosphatase